MKIKANWVCPKYQNAHKKQYVLYITSLLKSCSSLLWRTDQN